ncbi:MAG: flagellar biosynthesis protein FlhB [Pseudomonadota bacterium]|nr:flagellar biosynthesis protein FlhB [Pseudomonadota bacterium]
MAQNDQGQEKTEKATPKRREESHKKGQVAKSRELSSVAILVGTLIYFYFNAPDLLKGLMAMTKKMLGRAGQVQLTGAGVPALFAELAWQVVILLLPLMLTVVVVSLLANILQVGFIFSAEAMAPKFSKINPIKGMKNVLGLRAFVELLKNTLKIIVIGSVAYLSIRSEVWGFLPLMDQGAWQILSFIGGNAFKILSNVCWLLMVLAVLDYLYQRWEHEKNIKMTKQELKEENKQMEGDPLIKGRIRRLQREAARKRMMASVPKADVVITNPTHLAVALKYDVATMAAPVLLAKGAGHVAERIREIAGEHRIPIVENKWVARVLYRMVDIDGVIPENLYRAVAEILAYVYGLRNSRG